MELELFSFKYSPRAEAGAFRLQYLLPELELELFGSEIFHRAGAGAYKLKTFLLELELELRVLDKNVGAKSGAAKVMFQINLETNLKLYFLIFLAFYCPTIPEIYPKERGLQNPHLAFYPKQMDQLN